MFITPVFWCIKKCYYYIVFPIYSRTLVLRKRWQKGFGPSNNKFIYPFLAKPLVHVVVIILVFAVSAANLQASTIPAGNNDGSLLFSMMGQDIELIEETADQFYRSGTTSYLGMGYGVSTRQIISLDAAIPVTESFALMTTGGNAMASVPSVSGALPDASAGPRIKRTRNGIETYTVQSGDTISTIAAAFDVSSNTILWENNLGPRDFIRPGDELFILPVTGIQHTIKSGDTISKIASVYDVEAETIRSYNSTSDDTLSVGDSLIIPEGTRIQIASPTRITKAPINQVKEIFNKPPASSDGSGTSLLWPVPGHVITQYYGWRHTGIDIDGDYDDAIYAAEGGVVEVSGWGRGYGIQAVIRHPNGMKTRYAHMSKIFVSVGQTVARGEVIGMVGTTGYSTGTHIHFEVYDANGIRQNPLLYIR